MPAQPSPRDWLDWLYAKLRRQRIHARKFDRYYSGESKLEIVTRDFREVFEGLFNPVRVNLCRVAVDVTMERLEVDGFIVGDDDNQEGADAARRIWLANDLDVMSSIAHTESGIKGTAFTLTWPGEDDEPIVSVEDPEEMVIARRTSPPYDVIAALKVWVDEWDGIEHADLYLPDEVRRFRRDKTKATLPGRGAGWTEATFDGGEESLNNPYGAVPVVEISDRQRLLKPPLSRLVDVAPLQDGSDKILADLIIAASFGAVPVRTATGLEFKTDAEGRPVDATGKPVKPFDVRADRVWISPKAESKFGTLEGSTLEGFVAARKAILGAYRTTTRVPLNYVGELEGTSHLTGEAVKALENPLVRLIGSVARRVGPGWAKTMQFALGPDYSEAPVRTRWADTETKVEAQQADAANKAKDMGVPLEVVLEQILGWPREVIRRTLAIRAQEGTDLDEMLEALRRDALSGDDDEDELVG